MAAGMPAAERQLELPTASRPDHLPPPLSVLWGTTLQPVRRAENTFLLITLRPCTGSNEKAEFLESLEGKRE